MTIGNKPEDFEKNILRTNGQNFSKFDENDNLYKSPNLER
jgi:hypothetical protein